MNRDQNSCDCAPASTGNARAAGRAAAPQAHPQTFRAPANVVETLEKFEVTLDVPGAARDSIDIRFHDGVLHVSARVGARTPAAARPVLREFGVGDYRRDFRVGEDVNAEAIAARYEAGVLTIELPKTTRPGPRRVPVSAA